MESHSETYREEMYVMSNIGNQYDINMLNTRLKEMRSLRKLTQQELADAIGVKGKL